MRHHVSMIAVLGAAITTFAACGQIDSGESTADEPAIAEAKQAISPTRTPWQMHNGLEAGGSNPLGLLPFSCNPSIHGQQCEYDVVCNTSPLSGPCLTSIPTANHAGWAPAPNGSTIGFAIPSRVCQAPVSCMRYGDFTYFQTFVDVPAGSTVTQFSIAFSGMDDGSRITIFNSAYPTGLVVPGSYVFLGGSGTSNLQSYIVAGEVNRVVVTQVDDCCSENNLHSAVVVLNGTDVPVCGNGVLEAGEECDDGNGNNFDGCSSTCQIEHPVCGNGIVELGEGCDDGNAKNGDGCSVECKVETCRTLSRGNSPVEDTWIATNDPGSSYGASTTLTMGGLAVGQTLLRFDTSAIPVAAKITKGFLRVSQSYAGNDVVNAHIITAPWSEGTTTFANFGASFVSAPFTSSVMGGGVIPPIYFDMVSTLQAWVDGSVPNHGVLLDQGLSGQRIIRSSEDPISGFRPAIEVCYTTN